VTEIKMVLAIFGQNGLMDGRDKLWLAYRSATFVPIFSPAAFKYWNGVRRKLKGKESSAYHAFLAVRLLQPLFHILLFIVISCPKCRSRFVCDEQVSTPVLLTLKLTGSHLLLLPLGEVDIVVGEVVEKWMFVSPEHRRYDM
jgi:hypothetical protein